MKLYKNEAAFKQDAVAYIRRLGYQVTEIESGNTQVGIPDTVVTTPEGDVWIEFKRTKYNMPQKEVRVSWRPGQQAWALMHYKSSATRHPALTLIAFDDCIAGLWVMKHYPNNIVPVSDFAYIGTSVKDIFKGGRG